MSEDLVKNLLAIHNKLKNEFLNQASQDVGLARKLEDFLNYAIYNNHDAQQRLLGVSGALSLAHADELKKDTRLKGLFMGEGTSQELGNRGEKAFAAAIVKIVNTELKEHKLHIGDTIEKMNIGSVSATIIADEIAQKHSQAILSALQSEKKSNIRHQYSSWNARQGKIDIDTSQAAGVEIISKLSPEAQSLLNMTLSVKNYRDWQIKLERVNKDKAYRAILSTLPGSTRESLENAYKDTYEILKNRSRYGADIEAHLTHIAQLYALTGYGQTYLKTDNLTGDLIKKYARFLAINNRKERKIIIRSTAEIVANEILNSSGANQIIGWTSSRNDKYYKAYYNMSNNKVKT